MKKRYRTQMYTISKKENKIIILNSSKQNVRIFVIYPGFPIKTLCVKSNRRTEFCLHQNELGKRVERPDEFSRNLNCSIALLHYYIPRFEIKKQKGKNFFEIKEKVVKVKSLQTLTRLEILRGSIEMVKNLPYKLQNELQVETIEFFFPSHMNYVQRRVGLVYRQDYKEITKIPMCFCQ